MDKHEQIRRWIDSGESRIRTINKACKAYGISYAEAQSLVSDTMAGTVASMQIDRAEFLAQQMTRMEALAVRAQEEDQLGVALGAFKELHALAGLYQK